MEIDVFQNNKYNNNDYSGDTFKRLTKEVAGIQCLQSNITSATIGNKELNGKLEPNINTKFVSMIRHCMRYILLSILFWANQLRNHVILRQYADSKL